MAANVDLALEEEKKAFKEYLLTKNVSDKSANVAVSKAFGIWKLKDRDVFEALMKSEDFEKDARELLVEIYNGNEKKASAYYSELRRYYIYYLEKNGLPVPDGIMRAKPGRKPGSGKAAEEKDAAEKKRGRRTAAGKSAEGKDAAGKKRGRKPAEGKAAEKKEAAGKRQGRKRAEKTAEVAASSKNAASSNAALVKAINELNKTLAPIAKLAQKFK